MRVGMSLIGLGPRNWGREDSVRNGNPSGMMSPRLVKGFGRIFAGAPHAMNTPRHLLLALLLCSAAAIQAQNVIWSHAIGNWRNGPVVYITPVIETTEAFTTPQLLDRYREEFPELRDVQDIDVLRFASPEEGEESRTILRAKYGMRKLEVRMLEVAPDLDRED